MPHAVLLGARRFPDLPSTPLARDGARLHKVIETLRAEHALVLKSLILEQGAQTRLLVRLDLREDGIVVRLDDHLSVERTRAVFDHLAHVARAVLEANPGATVGQTNLDLVPKSTSGSA